MTMAAANGNSEMDMAAARAHARAVVERSGTSFGLGMRILSRRRRDGMFALYAFCREIDDIADEGGTQAEKLAALAAWRAEIDRLYEGHPTKPTAVALSEHIGPFDLPKEEFVLLIVGMEMDARGPIQAPERAVLSAYCRRVAGAVIPMSISTARSGAVTPMNRRPTRMPCCLRRPRAQHRSWPISDTC